MKTKKADLATIDGLDMKQLSEGGAFEGSQGGNFASGRVPREADAARVANESTKEGFNRLPTQLIVEAFTCKWQHIAHSELSLESAV